MIKLPFDLSQFKQLKIKKPEIRLAIPTVAFLGIDIGTSSLKIAEVSKTGERIKLENYAEMQTFAFYEKPFRTFEKNTLLLSEQDLSKAIVGMLQEAKIKTRRVIFSIPDFSTFFTTFELPPMSEEELRQAVEYEARQHVPIPLTDITLDWQVVSGRPSVEGQKRVPMKILLVAVPNEVVNQYQQMAALSNLDLLAIEAEVFSLARAVALYETEVVILVDIGAQTTTVSAVEKGQIKLSHSFDIGGNEFTRRIAQSLQIDYLAAEKLKREQGLEHSVVEGEIIEDVSKIPKSILAPLIDLVIAEIGKLSRAFLQQEGKEAKKIILAGGSALLPGLPEYMGYQIKEEIVVANPFEDLFYPTILEETLKKMGPAWAVAVGAARRGLE